MTTAKRKNPLPQMEFLGGEHANVPVKSQAI